MKKNILLILISIFTTVILAGCKLNLSDNSTVTEPTTTVLESNTSVNATTIDETTTEMPSTTENDGRADYWEDAYLFNLMPYFLDGDFAGYLSSENKETLAFTNLTEEFVKNYISLIENNAFFLEPSVNEGDGYISFTTHDEVMIFYYVYYDKTNGNMDLSIDSSAVNG